VPSAFHCKADGDDDDSDGDGDDEDDDGGCDDHCHHLLDRSIAGIVKFQLSACQSGQRQWVFEACTLVTKTIRLSNFSAGP